MTLRRRLLTASVAIVALVPLLSISTPAHAVSVSKWRLTYGASITTGEVRWTSGRHAYMTIYLKAVSGNRGVQWVGHDANGTGYWSASGYVNLNANTEATWDPISLHIDQPGGVQGVTIEMWAGGVRVHTASCVRRYADCVTMW